YFVAAEKRDYAEHSTFRQQVSQNFFLLAGAGKPRQLQPPSSPQPLSLLRLQRGLCCEGANIRPDRRALQHVCHEPGAENVRALIQTLDR
ncbi:hypothetical protein MYF61_29085, partial [Klebsiella quasipneumoniae]|uniref:hypothetical protein n=1 Tax=Klebsiella quasipneumoniae TaxID=1463165 RepID=UPI0020348F4B